MSSFLEGIKFGLGFILVLGVLGILGFVYASGWHVASEIFPGTFQAGHFNFTNGITIGNDNTTLAGTIRWSGNDFEGFDGNSWKSLTSGSEGNISCPNGFFLIQNQNKTLGCMQKSLEGINTACTTAVLDCFDTYGGRLPTYNELYIAINRYATNMTDELTDHEWIDVGHYYGSYQACGALTTAKAPSAWPYTSTTPSYRCFIPLTSGGGSSSGTNLPTCSNEQILKYNATSSSWYCADLSGVGGGGSISAFSVNRNGVDQTSIAVSTDTKIDWTTKVFDENSEFNLTTDRFEPKTAGKYLLTGTATILGVSDTKGAHIILYKNGSRYLVGTRSQSSGTDNPRSVFSAIVDAKPGDYFEVYVRHWDSSSKSLGGQTIQTSFSGAKIDSSSSSSSGFDFSFGDYETKSEDVVYQAQTDGFVIVSGFTISGTTSVCRVFGYSDNTTNPSTLIANDGSEDGGGYKAQRHGFTMPVKKGNYWKVTNSGGFCSNTVYWLPINKTQSGGGGFISCPTNFTSIESQGRQLGCMQINEEGIDTWENAVNTCFTKYGGRLPTSAEWYIAMNNYNLNNETDDWEWNSDAQDYTGVADMHALSGLGSISAHQTNVDSGTPSFRCFIPN